MSKKIAMLVLLMALAALMNLCCANAENFALDNYEEFVLPYADYNLLFSDAMQRYAAEALRGYYLSIASYSPDLFDQIWQHKMMILSDPYIFKTEWENEVQATIYCCSALDAYKLVSYSDTETKFISYDNLIGVYRIDISVFEDGEYRIRSVYRLEGLSEELYPGSGVGGDGIPGLSDTLIAEMDGRGFSTQDIAEKYLRINEIHAECEWW